MKYRILETSKMNKFKYEYYPVYKIQKKVFGVWLTKVITIKLEESFYLLEKVKADCKKPEDKIIYKENNGIIR